jgi:hypothetical protein
VTLGKAISAGPKRIGLAGNAENNLRLSIGTIFYVTENLKETLRTKMITHYPEEALEKEILDYRATIEDLLSVMKIVKENQTGFTATALRIHLDSAKRVLLKYKK